MIDPELLEILACPGCKGALDADDAHGALVCPACRLRFRVEDGIPIMLMDQAEPLDPEAPKAS